MWDGSDPVLRVNAAGILAKVHGNDAATNIGTVLDGDQDVRDLYMTAVLARVCALDWATAQRLAANPLPMPKKAAFVATRLAGEIVDGTVHAHAVMAVDGDRGLSGHLHSAVVGTHFARAYIIPA